MEIEAGQAMQGHKDKRSDIESDPNRIDDQGYIVRLVGQVITVSVETMSWSMRWRRR